MDPLQYPIGKHPFPSSLTAPERAQAIGELSEAPDKLEAAVQGLSREQLDTPYRPGGWTVRQVVHHLADAHSASLLRIRVALTAHEPTAMLYDVNALAELPDAKDGPIGPSLSLFRGAHERLVLLLRSLGPDDFSKSFRHPERGDLTIDWNMALYAWHARHHTAHITGLRERQGW